MSHENFGKNFTKNTEFICAVVTLELQSSQVLQWQNFTRFFSGHLWCIREIENDLFQTDWFHL